MSNGIDLNLLNWGNYDLVVIDESHNFRNGEGGEGVHKGKRENRYQTLMRKVIQAGVKTKVLMLSATPVNNRFTDLRNQLALAYEGNPEFIDERLDTSKPINKFARSQLLNEHRRHALIQLGEVKIIQRLLVRESCCFKPSAVLVFLSGACFRQEQVQQQIAEIGIGFGLPQDIHPFMALDRTDANNETWSRVAGQFAMREVIKRLEGAQYVRDYWNMENFYSFSGGAPAVYLTYARWLAENGIAHAGITGDITASNMSTSISGSQYIGTVTLKTDADLIRIPRTVGTLTGNTGGADSEYYYLKSGDTIHVVSANSHFSVDMESISSDAEEARFLVGVPSVTIQKIMVPIYGHPYALKSATLVFELSLGEIRVIKATADGTGLKGAVFELLDNSNKVLATASSNANGVAAFTGLQPGKYIVREKTPPQGFKLAETTTQGAVVTAGETCTVTFVNKSILGRIRVVKTDTLTGQPLAGAVFSITRLSGPDSYTATNIGKVVAVITTDENGVAETPLLTWGEYQVSETSVPEGYIDSGFTTTVKIN